MVYNVILILLSGMSWESFVGVFLQHLEIWE